MREPQAASLRESHSRAHHLQMLDLLRGVAAICVVLFHFSSRVEYGDFMYHGYLAVDFFFVLSGYVFGRAYQIDIRGGSISFRSFATMRLIRLMPMVVLGNLIAAFTDLFRTGDFSFGNHLVDIAVSLVLGCLLLPIFFKTTLEGTTYPLNGPIWSLFFELFANFVFFPLARRRDFKLIASTICALSLAILALYSLETGNIHFGPHAAQFWLAVPRVFFSFFLGTLLNCAPPKRRPLNRWVCMSLVVAVIAVPSIENLRLSAAFDIVVIALLSPLIIWACGQGSPRHSRIARISGNLSFPIYCIHYPIVRAASAVIRHFSLPIFFNIMLSLIVTAVLIVTSLLIFDAYDRPVRRRLSALLLPSSRPADSRT